MTSADWKQIRQQVLERDNNNCQICERIAEHVHHIIPRRKAGLNSVNNLISLCVKCHRLIELKQLKQLKPFVKKRCIAIDTEVYESLSNMGHMGDTYSDVIRQLVKDKEQRAKK